MPTSLNTSFVNGDVIDVDHVKQFAEPLNDLESGAAIYRVDSGTANAYQVDFSDVDENGLAAYTPGLLINFKAGNANTGASTLTVVGTGGTLAAIPIKKTGSADLSAGDIKAGQLISVIYNDENGGRFELVGGVGFEGGAGVTGSGTTDKLAKWTSMTTVGDSGITDDGTTVTVGVAGSRSLSCPQGTNSERFGAGAGAVGPRNTSVGAQAGASNSTGADNVFIGYQAGDTGTSAAANVVIGSGADLTAYNTASTTVVGQGALGTAITTVMGQGASATSSSSVALGRGATVAATSSLAIGDGASCTAGGSIALGRSALADQSATMVIGSPDYPISDIFFGRGRTTSNTSNYTSTLNATGGSGTDRAGAHLRLAGGRPTGSGVGGKVILATATSGSSGSTPGTLVDWFELDQDGVIFLKNAASAPASNPSGGHYLFADGGALKGRGSSGTVTTIAAAEPHCQRCDRDFALEWQNPRYGHLAVCGWCLTDALESMGVDVTIRKEAVHR